MIVDETLKILSANNQFAKKMYGQNFLINKHILEKIINISGLNKEDGVIEIGTGLGTLTEYLSLNAKKVLTYEIDNDMENIALSTLNKYNNISFVLKDFLKTNVNQDIDKYLSDCKRILVISNLPYYVTTPILFKLLNETTIESFTLMVQKEMGERFTGKPNTKDYNALSVLMKYKTDTTIETIVKSSSFYPAPKVDSVIINVKRIKSDYTLNNEVNFEKFIESIFTQRRKTLINNLCSVYGYNKNNLNELFNNNNININIRSEALNLDEIVKIYKLIFE